MALRAGTANLPLHGGQVPKWLADRMTRLGAVLSEAIVHHYGRDELLRRLAHPFWFQSFGAVMGMDWHSSGITTSVIGALVLQPIIEKVWRTCEGTEIRARTVTPKVKYADFQQITRSRTGQALLSTRAEIEQVSYALLEPLFPVTKGIRLLGMTLSSLAEKQLESEPQLNLSF